MKNCRFCILLGAILWASYGFAQVSLGAFTGLNMAKLAGDSPNAAKYKTKIGLNAGAILDIGLSETVTLSFQPSYSQEGTKMSYTVANKIEPVDSITVGLNYVSLPIFVKVKAGNPKFYALAGVETGILMDSWTDNKAERTELDVPIADFNLAIHFGAGYKIFIGRPNLFIELRYAHGLVNLTDEPLKDNIIPRVKTGGYKLMFGVEFPLTKENN